MPLFIRDEKVHTLAKELAEARHTTVTEAVRQALEKATEALKLDRAERDLAIRKIFAELDAMPDTPFDERDMYDQDGLPR